MKNKSTEEAASLNRRSFLTRATLVGGAALLPFAGLARAGQDWGKDDDRKDCDRNKSGLAEGDRDIIIAAEIAEALAVTTYSNIINTSPFFRRCRGMIKVTWLARVTRGNVPLSPGRVRYRPADALHQSFTIRLECSAIRKPPWTSW